MVIAPSIFSQIKHKKKGKIYLKKNNNFLENKKISNFLIKNLMEENSISSKLVKSF